MTTYQVLLLLTRISIHPTRAHRQHLNPSRRQLSAVLGHDDHHGSFRGGIPHEDREARDAGELDVGALAGDGDYLLGVAGAE